MQEFLREVMGIPLSIGVLWQCIQEAAVAAVPLEDKLVEDLMDDVLRRHESQANALITEGEPAADAETTEPGAGETVHKEVEASSLTEPQPSVSPHPPLLTDGVLHIDESPWKQKDEVLYRLATSCTTSTPCPWIKNNDFRAGMEYLPKVLTTMNIQLDGNYTLMTIEYNGLSFHLSPQGLVISYADYEIGFNWQSVIPIGRYIYWRYQLNPRRLYYFGRIKLKIPPSKILMGNELKLKVEEEGITFFKKNEEGEWECIGSFPRSVIEDRSKSSVTRQLASYMNGLRKIRKEARKEKEAHEGSEDQMQSMDV